MTDVPSTPWRPYPALDDAQRIAAARAVHDAMATRRSCRAFADTPVPRAAIEWAIRTAGTAPSGIGGRHTAIQSVPIRSTA